MTHQSQLENRKYRNWVKAGLGLKYTKEGLEPLCDQLVTQQHVDILKKVKQKHNLSAVSCANCEIKTLQPDHVRTRSKQCPLGQMNCNCQHPGGKISCSVCGAIYDGIIKLHASTPPSPYWKNTDAKHWCTEPWAVAKCFINAAGYDRKLTASEFDCSGLLHILINNMDFRDHLNCTTDGTDLLQKVLQHRNMIYHSHDMELENEDVTTYIDDMIALLQDDKELINMEQSKAAVEKLKALKGEDFVITTTNETEIRRVVMADVDRITEEAEKQKHELEQTGKENRDQVARTGNMQITDLEQKGNEVSEQVVRTGNMQITDLEQKGNEVNKQVVRTGNRQITDLEQKGNEVSDQVARTGYKQVTDLEQKRKEACEQVARSGNRQITDLEQKRNEINEQVVRTGNRQIIDLEQKGNEVNEQVARTINKQITDLEQKGKEASEQVARTGNKQIIDLEQKGKEASEHVARTGIKQITDLEQKGKEASEQVARTVNRQITSLEQKWNEASKQVARTGNMQISDLEHKGKEANEQVARTVNKQITDLEQKGIDIQKNVKSDLTEKGNQVKDEIVSTGTKVKTELKEDIRAETIKTKRELEQKHTEMMVQFETKLDVKLGQKVKGDLDYNRQKIKFQKKLVNNYMQYALKVSALPLQPDKNQTNIANMYASPWMVVELWDESSKYTKEIVISFDEIFSNEEKLSKYIYILGEAGSGKTALCKYLVYYWCLAHGEHTATNIKSKAVTEMGKYDFLFFISLRHFSDFDTIENMLDETYPDPILRTILQNESDKCLIILDGLDEWTPQNQRPSQFLTPGLPARDLHAEYTIITTTRRWKFDSLHITDNEIHKKIQLKGITGIAITDLTKTTIKKLNEMFHKNKVAEDFEPALKRSPVADLSHVPMMLQQLICLWFDGKLRGTSKCSVYSSMLDLFFDWKALKHCGNQIQMLSELEIDSKLPEYLSEYQACCDNTNVIYHLSRLAYKTLFNRNTKDTLTFSNSTFKQLKIPDDVKMCSLNAGILSEHLNTSLFASARQHSSFSFVHKSMQEFLAAIRIAMHFEKDVSRSENFEEKCQQCIRNYFSDCKTVVDILEQSNVFIMLCGLEPKLLPYMTEYTFNVIKVDEKMIEERKVLPDNCFDTKIVLQKSIQKCIINCIQEASLEDFPKNSIYIADIVLGPEDDLIPYLHRQIFNLHSVVSLVWNVMDSLQTENLCVVLKLLTECDSLRTLKYYALFTLSRETEEQAADIISRNKTTLQCVSLYFVPAGIVRTLVQIMPAMSQLISIRISPSENLSHEIHTSLCTYLEQSVHLQRIDLAFSCEKDKNHLINLARHKQLQYLDTQLSVICVTSLNKNSLQTCKVCVSSSVMINQLCDSLYNARKLKCLSLAARSILRYSAAKARSDTEDLIRLLPTLTSLSTVELQKLTVTDNIITSPSDMKNLKEIKLFDVTMSMTTWYKFVDSLTKLPRNVLVSTSLINTEDFTRNITCFSERVKFNQEAQRYARETNSFRVRYEDNSYFVFESKKTDCEHNLH